MGKVLASLPDPTWLVGNSRRFISFKDVQKPAEEWGTLTYLFGDTTTRSELMLAKQNQRIVKEVCLKAPSHPDRAWRVLDILIARLRLSRWQGMFDLGGSSTVRGTHGRDAYVPQAGGLLFIMMDLRIPDPTPNPEVPVLMQMFRIGHPDRSGCQGVEIDVLADFTDEVETVLRTLGHLTD